MSIVKISFSPTGGTDRAAEALCRGLGGAEKSVDLCRPGEGYTAGSGDLCVVAAPAYGGRVPALAAERIAALRGSGARAVVLASFGNRAIDDTLLELYDLCTAAGFRVIAGVSAVTEHSLIRDFGAGRPDGADEAELQAFGERILREAGESPAIPGNRPYKEWKGGAVPALIGECIRCGKCAELCPAGAIPAEAPETTDAARCAYCMRCVSLCPQKARGLAPEMERAMREKLGALCAGRRENELFL
ncbi:MAG: 4Fe-4S binding protein [Oscillospiraceae bacterium]|nr:4Fe-4S binding protein [Oscillospiraceae bacterium]